MVSRLGVIWIVAAALHAQFLQQGSKLVAGDAIGMAQQGVAVALSADGNTALIGGLRDNNDIGAAWVFTRSGGAWTEQAKLVGSGVIGSYAYQGIQVALSRDGNTAIVGGTGDAESTGAAWLFTRSGTVWTQQAKLVGTGYVGQSFQGFRVALSGDGNTAVVGGTGDDNNAGATWVFTRSQGVWTQQGSKLVGTGAVGEATQGWSVALSCDGDTAVSSGAYDNNSTGAAWVFTRSNGIWTQQGNKLVGSGAPPGTNWEGWAVALSPAGDEAVLQGTPSDGAAGALWTFTQSNGVWTQQGNPTVVNGADYVTGLSQGQSVALSAEGTLAVMGGPGDEGGVGATWVFTGSGGPWMQIAKLVGSGFAGLSWQGYAVAVSADGGTILIGGPTDNNSMGAAWVFSATPLISSGGVVNAGSFQPVLAPGADASIFGAHFAATAVAAASTPFPLTLGGVSVTVNEIAAPMIYAGTGQINFQVPYETAIGAASIVVSVNGVPSPRAQVSIAPTAPGVLFSTGGQAIAQNQDYSLNGPTNPAQAGSYLTVYLVGGGMPSPPVATGAPAPLSPLSTFAPVTASIGGSPANVAFAGLTPGSVGLMQINLQVPNLPAGTYPVRVTMGSSTGNTPTVAVAR
ncbi:MAG TPA: hypothetical protein VIY49_29525 [Bryobacteraceae bacterium]